jgi:hypothetical protein
VFAGGGVARGRRFDGQRGDDGPHARRPSRQRCGAFDLVGGPHGTREGDDRIACVDRNRPQSERRVTQQRRADRRDDAGVMERHIERRERVAGTAGAARDSREQDESNEVADRPPGGSERAAGCVTRVRSGFEGYGVKASVTVTPARPNASVGPARSATAARRPAPRIGAVRSYCAYSLY